MFSWYYIEGILIQSCYTLLIVLGLGGLALLVLLVILAIGAAALAISGRRKR